MEWVEGPQLYRRSTVLVGDTTCGKAEGGQEWLRNGVG